MATQDTHGHDEASTAETTGVVTTGYHDDSEHLSGTIVETIATS